MTITAAKEARPAVAAFFAAATLAAVALLRYRLIADDAGIRLRCMIRKRHISWHDVLGVDVQRSALTIHARDASIRVRWVSAEHRRALVKLIVEHRGFSPKPAPSLLGVLARYAAPSAAAQASLVHRREHPKPITGSQQEP